jgi:hypothetical protein
MMAHKISVHNLGYELGVACDCIMFEDIASDEFDVLVEAVVKVVTVADVDEITVLPAKIQKKHRLYETKFTMSENGQKLTIF